MEQAGGDVIDQVQRRRGAEREIIEVSLVRREPGQPGRGNDLQGREGKDERQADHDERRVPESIRESTRHGRAPSLRPPSNQDSTSPPRDHHGDADEGEEGELEVPGQQLKNDHEAEAEEPADRIRLSSVQDRPGQPQAQGIQIPWCSPTGGAGGSRRSRTPTTRTPPARNRPAETPNRRAAQYAPSASPERVQHQACRHTPARWARGRRGPVGRVIDPHLALADAREAVAPEVVPDRQPASPSARSTPIRPRKNCVTSPPTGIRPPKPIGQSQGSNPAIVSTTTPGTLSRRPVDVRSNSSSPGP